MFIILETAFVHSSSFVVSTIVNEISQAIESSTTGNVCLYLAAHFGVIIVALFVIVIVMAVCKYIQILNFIGIILIIIIIIIISFFFQKKK